MYLHWTLKKLSQLCLQLELVNMKTYTQCSWQTEGKGQFMPIHDAKPIIGKIDEKEIVPELKVEMMCHKDIIKNVVNSMKNSHPYESVAYTVIKKEKI